MRASRERIATQSDTPSTSSSERSRAVDPSPTRTRKAETGGSGGVRCSKSAGMICDQAR
jgi:hypothetical protein